MTLKQKKSRLLKLVEKPEIGSRIAVKMSDYERATLGELLANFLSSRQQYYDNPVAYAILLELSRRIRLLSEVQRFSYAEALAVYGLVGIALEAQVPERQIVLQSIYVKLDQKLIL